MLISAALLISFYTFTSIPYLTFSDGAKYAEVARNIFQGMGYGSRFTTFPNSALDPIRPNLFTGNWILPVIPMLLLVVYKLFGVSDMAVIATSGVFYFGVVVMTYLIGKKIFGELPGFLAGLAMAFHIPFLAYATTGATETLFTFELLVITYLFLNRKPWSNIAGFAGFVVLYFTRPHAPIYIVIMAIFYILLNSKSRKQTLRNLAVLAISGLAFELFSQKFQGKYFITSVFKKAVVASLHFSSLQPANAGLREIFVNPTDVLVSNLGVIIKKTLYNIYNFYKLLPEIASPYLWALFSISLFRWGKNKSENSFKTTVLVMVILVFGVTALTVPLYRYLHPVIPFVYLFAVATLVWILGHIFSRQRLLKLASLLLIIFFVAGQSLGYIFLDTRFKNKSVNRDKPPVYVTLSRILKENTDSNQTIITNLDTWGTWYGERKTIWFPLIPEQLTQQDPKKISYDVIYLTSYLMDDENYYMGPEWKSVFENPRNPGNELIAKSYVLKGIYTVSAEDTYEKISARAVLLLKK